METTTSRVIPLEERLLTRDLDARGLAFWGIVSGEITQAQADAILNDAHSTNLVRSAMASRLQNLLSRLAGDGILNPATPSLPFDADRRCLRCGTIHADHSLLARSGTTCFRDLWGTVPLNTAGLRRGIKR